MWQPSLTANEPDRLLGYPLYTSPYAPTDAIAFGDIKYYNIGDRGTRSDVPELLAGADVFIHLPDCAEGFGIAVVEALASGLICVCNDRGALPEIVEDGVSGLIVKSGDSVTERLRSLIPGSAQWERIRRGAVEAAQKFSIETFAAKLDDLIEEP